VAQIKARCDYVVVLMEAGCNPWQKQTSAEQARGDFIEPPMPTTRQPLTIFVATSVGEWSSLNSLTQ
jgi:hypothetical protein